MDKNLYTDLNSDLYDLVDMIDQPIEELFYLKGEPDHSLGVCLKSSPDFIQEIIAETYKLELGKGKRRQRQLELLKEKIINEMYEQLVMVQYEAVESFIRLAAGGGDSEESEYRLELQKRGWVFCYIGEYELGTVVPDEIKEQLIKITKEKDFSMRLSYYEMYRSYIDAFLTLYGVFEKKWLLTVIENSDIEKDTVGTTEEKEVMGQEWTPSETPDDTIIRLQEELENFTIEDEYLIDPDLREDEDYKKLLDTVKGKAYYEPSPEEIMFYRKNYIDVSSKEYRILKKYLSKKVDSLSVESLMEEFSIEAIEGLGGIFSIMESVERYKVSFTSIEDIKDFERLFRNWEDHLRKWKNRGFTNLEMRERGEDGSYAEIKWDLEKIKLKEKKPEPGDPCPCGSGKKYRQCCGRGGK